MSKPRGVPEAPSEPDVRRKPAIVQSVQNNKSEPVLSVSKLVTTKYKYKKVTDYS